MCHTPQLEYAKIDRDSFDFRPFFHVVKDLLSDADLTFGNLETVTAGISMNYTGYPLFNSPDELLDALKYAGLDLLFTSNNHSLDRGVEGIKRTIQAIRKRELVNSGTFLSERDRDSLLIIDLKGIRIGILSYTYGLNGNFLPKSKSFMINVIDTILIQNDVSKLTEADADLILVYFHFGEEYSRNPSKFQREIVSKTFSYGADIIIGSHPHVIQPLEIVEEKDSKLKNRIVAYSLGNFISNQRWRYSDAGVILNLDIKKNTRNDSLWIDKISFIPTWVFKGIINGRNQFVILPSDTTLFKDYPVFLSNSDKQKLIESYNDTKEILFK